MDFPFHGIPTVPPRKDTTHLVSARKREREKTKREKENKDNSLTQKKKKKTFFCRGCRYRVTAEPSWTSSKVKRALWEGGISRSNREDGKGSTPGMKEWGDLVSLTRERKKKRRDKGGRDFGPSTLGTATKERKKEKNL